MCYRAGCSGQSEMEEDDPLWQSKEEETAVFKLNE